MAAMVQGIKDAWAFAGTSMVTSYMDLGTGILILWVGGSLALDPTNLDGLTVGRLVAFQLYWNVMNDAYQQLQSVFMNLTRAAAAAERVFSLLDQGPDIDPTAGEPIDWAVKGHLQLDAVTFYYQMRPDNAVLTNMSLDIPAGSVCALVGRSGGGKSTVISLLLRFYDPKSGCVKLDGRDVRELRVKELRGFLGVVQQETQLFARSIEDNILYGTPPGKYTHADVEHAATLACAHGFISELTDGYDTRVGDRGSRLSGGQRQRIAIARAFLRRPRILLLDEATSSLDAESESMVQAALDELIASAGATVVLVAHRLSTVMNADKIAVVDKGRIVEEGNHDALLKHDGVYAKLVKKQVARSAASLNQAALDGVGAGVGVGMGKGGSKTGEGGGDGNGGTSAAKQNADDIDGLLDALAADMGESVGGGGDGAEGESKA